MATFFAKKTGGDLIDASPSLPVAGASYEEESPYWNTTPGKPPQQQHGVAPVEGGTRLAKLPGIEIGTTLVNDIGDLAKNLGDQASQNTTELVTGAVKAYTRLKGKVKSAVDGVGYSAETKRESAGEAEACWGLEPDQEEEEKEEEEGGGHEEANGLGTEQESHSAAVDPSSTKNETSADASAANLQAHHQQQQKKKAQAQLKQVAVGGAGVAGGAAAVGVGSAALTKPLLSDYDAVKHNRGGDARGAGWAPSAGSAAAAEGGGLKILPRTASLVGGKSWAVLSAVCDAAVAAVDETIGDML